MYINVVIIHTHQTDGKVLLSFFVHVVKTNAEILQICLILFAIKLCLLNFI